MGDFSVVLFRPTFMLFSEKNRMHTSCNHDPEKPGTIVFIGL